MITRLTVLGEIKEVKVETYHHVHDPDETVVTVYPEHGDPHMLTADGDLVDDLEEVVSDLRAKGF